MLPEREKIKRTTSNKSSFLFSPRAHHRSLEDGVTMAMPPHQRPIVLFGSGGHAREVADIVLHSKQVSGTPEFYGFLDEDKKKHNLEIDGYPVLGSLDWLASRPSEFSLIVAIGNIPIRRRICEEAKVLGISFAQAISPLADFCGPSTLGPGCMIFPRAVVSRNVSLGKHVVLGVHSSVSHDSTVGDYSFLCPGSRLTGEVTLGSEVMLGTNASIIPGKSVGNQSIIGAGATVVSDLPSGVTALGVPARIVNK